MQANFIHFFFLNFNFYLNCIWLLIECINFDWIQIKRQPIPPHLLQNQDVYSSHRIKKQQPALHSPLLVPTQTRYSQVRKRRAAMSSGTTATRIRHILWQEDESPCSTELEQSRNTAGNKDKGGEAGGVSGKVRREGGKEGQMKAAGILTFLAGRRKEVEERKAGVIVQIQNHCSPFVHHQLSLQLPRVTFST